MQLPRAAGIGAAGTVCGRRRKYGLGFVTNFIRTLVCARASSISTGGAARGAGVSVESRLRTVPAMAWVARCCHQFGRTHVRLAASDTVAEHVSIVTYWVLEARAKALCIGGHVCDVKVGIRAREIAAVVAERVFRAIAVLIKVDAVPVRRGEWKAIVEVGQCMDNCKQMDNLNL